MKITLTARPGSKSTRFPKTLELDGTPKSLTAHDLAKAIQREFPKYTLDRQRVTTPDKKVLDAHDSATLASFGIEDGGSVQFKDLGPQIGWQTVFLIEYGGPLFIHPIFYYLSKLIYGTEIEHSTMQTLTFIMVMLHFLKREYETLFVHRFSHGTMPFRNIFKNSAHYWILSGVNLAFWVYGPWFQAGKAAAARSDLYIYACLALWVFGELSNLKTHYTVRNLRPPGTKTRAIPYGYGFSLVSFPNYFFEFISWTTVCFLTKSWSAVLFNVVATGQMYVWAIKKHKAYKRDFPNYPKNRKAMFPLIA
ncbi:hypothetical protein BZG36_01629 [Bifiguratus adelaidae]|uniref:very-long-chain enoyl-CoA reductase n=1 Tax=Bifiguratus adelaidae TaxID=1938954 RepID=A0A261Y4B8_9FUNG|nr:hypothetical protein BZG36_01629 [Bifiguratus adelaidae]